MGSLVPDAQCRWQIHRCHHLSRTASPIQSRQYADVGKAMNPFWGGIPGDGQQQEIASRCAPIEVGRTGFQSAARMASGAQWAYCADALP